MIAAAWVWTGKCAVFAVAAVLILVFVALALGALHKQPPHIPPYVDLDDCRQTVTDVEAARTAARRPRRRTPTNRYLPTRGRQL